VKVYSNRKKQKQTANGKATAKLQSYFQAKRTVSMIYQIISDGEYYLYYILYKGFNPTLTLNLLTWRIW